MTGRASLLIVALAATAAAEPTRKHAPDKFAKAAGELFAKAVAADDKGETKAALELYAAAFDLTPHENIAFNLADLEARAGKLRDAIRSYELYLALAPSATDRAAVEAEIARLERAPIAIEIAPSAVIDLGPAYVLVDGDIVKQPGAALPPIRLPPGRHAVDIITPTTSESDAFFLPVGAPSVTIKLDAPARLEGSAVISAHELRVSFDRVTNETSSRLQLPKGHYRAAVEDRQFECPPVSVDVPGGSDVAYVYIGFAELAVRTFPNLGPMRCRKLAVKTHTLVFKP